MYGGDDVAKDTFCTCIAAETQLLDRTRAKPLLGPSELVFDARRRLRKDRGEGPVLGMMV